MKLSLVFLLVAIYGAAADSSEEVSSEEVRNVDAVSSEEQVRTEDTVGEALEGASTILQAGLDTATSIAGNIESASNKFLDLKHQAFENGANTLNSVAQTGLGKASETVGRIIDGKTNFISELVSKKQQLLENIKKNQELDAVFNKFGSLGGRSRQMLNAGLDLSNNIAEGYKTLENTKLNLIKNGIQQSIAGAQSALKVGTSQAIAAHDKISEVGKAGIQQGLSAGVKGMNAAANLGSNLASGASGLGAKLSSSLSSSLSGGLSAASNAASSSSGLLGGRISGGVSSSSSSSSSGSLSLGAGLGSSGLSAGLRVFG